MNIYINQSVQVLYCLFLSSFKNDLLHKKTRVSVPVRPGEKIREFENQNFVNCLVLMCSSVFKLVYEKIQMFKIEYLSIYNLSFKVGELSITLKLN